MCVCITEKERQREREGARVMAAIVFGHAHNRGYRKFCLCKKRERVYSGSDRTMLYIFIYDLCL